MFVDPVGADGWSAGFVPDVGSIEGMAGMAAVAWA